jgi:hypothetical protein
MGILYMHTFVLYFMYITSISSIRLDPNNFVWKTMTFSLMGVQAIYQHIFPEVLGKTKVLYCPMTTVDVSRTLWSLTKLIGGHFFIHCSRTLASGENVIVFQTKLLGSNRMEEMEVMYMKYNTKV